MRNLSLPAATAIAPTLWGTTYLVTTELLPAGRPLLAGTLRALPAGLLLVGVVAALTSARALPTGGWWWRAAVLGTLNIGLFFALLFVAAYRLPGGVAAVLGALGPFVVAALAFGLLKQRPAGRVLVASGIGVAGVALLVLRSTTALDPAGLAAAAGGMASMSFGTVLGRRWGTPGGFADRRTALLALTGWQLTVGGLVLLPAAVLVEGLPAGMTWTNAAGFGYLSVVGTAGAYFLWFRGVTALPSAQVTLLGLLSPVGAAVLGWLVLDQLLSPGQLIGAAAVLGAVLVGATASARKNTRGTAELDVVAGWAPIARPADTGARQLAVTASGELPAAAVDAPEVPPTRVVDARPADGGNAKVNKPTLRRPVTTAP